MKSTTQEFRQSRKRRHSTDEPAEQAGAIVKLGAESTVSSCLTARLGRRRSKATLSPLDHPRRDTDIFLGEV